jgi:3-phosphoshikimate 1-carboxyvinyltransferase
MTRGDHVVVRPAPMLTGRIDVPADKSIAHRAAMLAAVSDGTSHIVHFPGARDPQSTLACIQALGASVSVDDDGILVVEGRGIDGLRPPEGALDCGNSGTTMRLLAGLLAGQAFESTLVGDESLGARPMGRIREPLVRMGAEVDLSDGHAPVRVRGRALRGITYKLPVASAQVKSCVLLAGLLARGTTTVVETVPSRDHTERMLGLDVVILGDRRLVSVEGGTRVPAGTWTVPGDFSSAAFWLVAGTIVPGSVLHLQGVGMNPTRSALVDVLRAMGADITVASERTLGGEPVADLVVRSAHLSGVTVSGAVIPALIDEIPVLAVAAAVADGRTVIADAAELRVKETDRLAAIAGNLVAMGARVEERPDGLVIEGGPALRGAEVASFGDHRIAMASGVAALVARGETTIHEPSCADVSYPGFWRVLERVAGRA